MNNPMSEVSFAESAINNLSNMIQDLTKRPDGEPRDLDSTVAAGVLSAQGAMAIAGALMVVAKAIGRRS